MCLLANDLQQVIKSPTRISEHSQTQIDLICVNVQHKVVQMEVLSSHLSNNNNNNDLLVVLPRGGSSPTNCKRLQDQSYAPD